MLDPGQHRPDHWQQPFLHVNHAGKQASQPFSRESDGSIFIYNLLIIMLATIFFPKKKEWERNVHNNVLESEFSLCRYLFRA